jgi:hypothetical protein
LTKILRLSFEEAEIVALKGLGFLANDPERLGRFLTLSGVAPSDVRAAAADRHFLAGVLNYLLQDESLLLIFTADEDLDPRLPAQAAEILNPAQC